MFNFVTLTCLLLLRILLVFVNSYRTQGHVIYFISNFCLFIYVVIAYSTTELTDNVK
jgi:hypothetical protein